MESIDLSKVTLMESGLCAYDSSFLGVLRSNGINYVSQILDDELMNNLFLKLKSNALRTRELKGFISLVKYKYLGIIDPEISKLDESIHIDIPQRSLHLRRSWDRAAVTTIRHVKLPVITSRLYPTGSVLWSLPSGIQRR
jgi:hypothetical protein